ncbi:MAG: DUF488 family protein [Acidobacteriota bacterium]|nr:DUF488 family protein [Acidobacteriota bacterium]
MIRMKRVYEPAESADGARFLVDRLWPRGIKKDALSLKAWLKDVAPSNELRNWYHASSDQWNEFRRRYFEELESNRETWMPLAEAARKGDITLLYSSKEALHNNATALGEFLEAKVSKTKVR